MKIMPVNVAQVKFIVPLSPPTFPQYRVAILRVMEIILAYVAQVKLVFPLSPPTYPHYLRGWMD
jgi:hypothetical protein